MRADGNDEEKDIAESRRCEDAVNLVFQSATFSVVDHGSLTYQLRTSTRKK